MHIWILWIVILFPTHRDYVKAYATQTACEHQAAIMQKIASDRYDWICLPATGD